MEITPNPHFLIVFITCALNIIHNYLSQMVEMLYNRALLYISAQICF